MCPKCDYVEHNESSEKSTKSDTAQTTNSEKAFEVFGEEDQDESRPTIKIECEKCGHDEAVWWMLQTRSADEPTTQFYRCTKCGYTWRNYA